MSKIQSKKSLIVFFSILFICIVGGIAAYYTYNKAAQQNEEYPKTKLSKSYGDNTIFYSCSREIGLRRTEYKTETGSPLYLPMNEDEAKLYCRSDGVIEYHAVLDVLELPATQDMIFKYGKKHVLVQALKAEYIKNREYIKRLLPAHKYIDIHCVIVVTTPNEKLYFLENGQDHGYINIPQTEFETYLTGASAEDRNTFLSALH